MESLITGSRNCFIANQQQCDMCRAEHNYENVPHSLGLLFYADCGGDMCHICLEHLKQIVLLIELEEAHMNRHKDF